MGLIFLSAYLLLNRSLMKKWLVELGFKIIHMLHRKLIKSCREDVWSRSNLNYYLIRNHLDNCIKTVQIPRLQLIHIIWCHDIWLRILFHLGNQILSLTNIRNSNSLINIKPLQNTQLRKRNKTLLSGFPIN